MDEIDLKIINSLKKNSRASTSEISRQVNLSIPAVSERIKKIEQSNIIQKYTIQINREKTKYKLLAFVFINTDLSKSIEEFKKTMLEYDTVLECHHISGEYDYLIKVLAEDTNELEEFISITLKKIRGIQKANTTIVLSTIKEEINTIKDIF
ncbi:Lrp/AsnC family transcriptional regulator [Clostridioides sp. ES-S-0190-01]|nr:Lrp/AsnC family transcriptional regulator [Clostridioides sp. ES-S-0049-03]MCC0650987.1 Lrp/AsnC family transcriptional regulator [Clostridioides sp. ES-S-0001-03]MCC0656261.1 Lrp/AsnC family transcriptional regulator [Clostridioides sp. ES-S-0123-01]MCC0671500.1 Lrp/AsnC family transcriptional regulator [Clostridioides sp. ES-S-0145-01]MCC0677757.1 Lrp/AsnC family transcriptional regulator [Clostridioides sp. ES-W-0018-02]MCC0681013.1 Lrp/AsnC family transcriptional regulator [Clostridioid